MNKKHNISFFEIDKWEKKYLSEKISESKLNASVKYFSHPLEDQDLKKISNTEILASFIYSEINKDVVAALPKLKYISTMSTGYDHINLPVCNSRNILVSNIPFYGTNTIAEYAFALMLAISRKILPTAGLTQRGNFKLESLMGFDLKGKTLGIVGLGNIGRHVVQIAKGFSMNIVAFDIKKDQKFAKEVGLKFVSLDQLFKMSDIVTLHAPLNKHTHHLINKKNIKKFKKGSVLINTARGGLIETDAIYEALDKGILSGAGLDVLEEDAEIIKDPRVIITPHNAFNSKEALERIFDTTIENISKFLKGKPQNLVN